MAYEMPYKSKYIDIKVIATFDTLRTEVLNCVFRS